MKIFPKWRAACAIALAGAVCVPVAHAEYPDRTIRLIVPTSPGSTADVVARVVAETLGTTLKQTIVVENLAGAAGIPGTRQLVGSNADGYTLGLVSSNHAINPSLYNTVPYDSVKDITPISIIGTTPLVLVVGENSPYKTVDDLIADARARPNAINIGSSGTGSVLHLASALLESKAKVDMMHIPYKGVSNLMTDVMSGQVHATFLATPSALAQISAGKLRALAVNTPARQPSLPGVPTLAESGVDGYAYDAWLALIGPASLPPDVVKTLRAAVVKTLASKKVIDALIPQGIVLIGNTPEEASAMIAREIETTRALVQSAGIKSE